MLRRKNKNSKIPIKLIAACLSVAAGCIIFAVILRVFFTRAAYFNITKVSILGADESLYGDFKRRLLGKNIFSQDLRLLKAQVEREEPDTKCLSIQRKPPGEVAFVLKKRVALAQIKLVRFHLIDDEASVLPQAQDLAFEGLPVIYLPPAMAQRLQSRKSYLPAELGAVVELIREKNNILSLKDYSVIKINISAQGAHSLYLSENFTKEQSVKDGRAIVPVEVKFGLDKPAETAKILALLLRKTPLANIEYIDLKNTNSPVILERKEKGKR